MIEGQTSFYPKDNAYLLGCEDAEKMFLDAWKKGTLHQSWLISGKKGIGKATFAYRLARFLLEADENKKGPSTELLSEFGEPEIRAEISTLMLEYGKCVMDRCAVETLSEL